MPNLVYMRGLVIRICRKLVEIWDAKLANFYREMYGGGKRLQECIIHLNT